MLTSVVWALVLIGTIGIRAATSVSLYRAALAAGLGRRVGTTVAVVAAALLFGWLIAVALMARYGVFETGPWAPVAVVIALLAVLATTRIPVLSRILTAPGAVLELTWPQTVRVIGVVFLILLWAGKASPLTALPVGIGDLAIGLAAPWVVRALARNTGHRWAFRFNVLGVADLTVAFVIGLVNGLVLGAPAGPSGALPLVLIPTTAVPLVVAIHIVALRRMAAPPRHTGTPAAATK